MFSTPVTFFAPQEPGYDPSYQEVLNYATSQGWALPSSTNQTKDNTLILALKAAGVWTKLDVFYMFSTDHQDFSLINWKSPGNFTATLEGTIVPSFTANSGFLGNVAGAGFIGTNFFPLTNGVNYTLNNASRHFWKGNTTTGIMDGTSQTNRNSIQATTSASPTGNQRINQAVQISGGNYDYATDVLGLKSIHRTSSTDVVLISNTTVINRTAPSLAALDAQSQWILRNATNGSSAILVRAYSMGASLVTENTAYRNALNTRLS